MSFRLKCIASRSLEILLKINIWVFGQKEKNGKIEVTVFILVFYSYLAACYVQFTVWSFSFRESCAQFKTQLDNFMYENQWKDANMSLRQNN